MGHRIRIAVLVLFQSFLGVAFAENFSDIWWSPLESGWGVTIADHDTNVFAVYYTYRQDGRPVWYVIPGGAFTQPRRVFQGDVYRTKGPAYTSATFSPSLVTVTKVGSAAFDFAPAGLAPGSIAFSYTIDGVSQRKVIERQAFGDGIPLWGFDHTDLWYNPAESGWGLSIAQHGNNIFGVWYAYDTDGEPLWFVLPGGTFTTSNAFNGTLYRTTGPYFGNATFDASQVHVTLAGTAQLSFSGTTPAIASKAEGLCPGISADFVATLGGATQQRITCPQAFGDPAPPPATGLKTCTGLYRAKTTFVGIPCSNGNSRSFSGRMEIGALGWLQPGAQQAVATFRNFFLQPKVSFVDNGPTGAVATCPDDDREDLDPGITINSSQSATGTFQGNGTIDLPIGQGQFTFLVPGGISVNGRFNYHYQFVNGGPEFDGTGTFACSLE